MREKLKEYVHLLFAGTVGTEDMEQEILQNTLDRFDDWVSRGFSEEDAYRQAVSGIGDMDGLLGKAAPAADAEVSYCTSLGKRICDAVAVALYILSPIPLFLFQNELGLCCLLGMVACGVVIQLLARKLMDDLQEEDPLSPGGRTGLTACAIALYILSPIPMFLLGNEIGLCCLLGMVAIGVAMQIVAGKGNAQPKKPEKGVQMDDLQEEGPLSPGGRTGLTACAIALYILSPIPLFLLGNEIGLCCLLGMVAIGVAMQIIAGKSTGQPMETEKVPQNEVQKSVRSLLGLLTLGVYLLVSFRTHAWWITWIIFPVADSLTKLVFALLGKHSLPKAALSVLLTIVLCAFLFSIPVKRLTVGALSIGNSANRGTESASQSFDASQVQSLEIDWVDGSVSIRRDTGDTLRYTVSGGDADRTAYTLKDGKLSIGAMESSVLNFGSHRGADLTVLVPKGWTPKELSAESISAPIQIENLTGTELDVDTVSGVMELKDIRADELSLSTISAKITCTGAAREISLETTSGNCALELTERTEKIDLDSVSGDLELFLPKAVGFTLRLDTVSGKFRSDFDYSVPKDDTYIFGDGSCTVNADTVSGNVNIRQK